MIFLEIGFILFLVIINGFFAMSELAVVSARRAKLAAMEARGVRGAKAARELAEQPGRFLSSVQIGITLVGVLAGAFGGATLAGRLAPSLTALGLSPSLAHTTAFVLVVLVVTYLSLIVGELVPKQIALANPEQVASLVARTMGVVARVSAPAVWFLTTSSRLVLRLLGQHGRRAPQVSEEEIRALVAEAESAGVVEPAETRMIGRVMRLGDLSVRAAMTPRPDVAWIDLDEPADAQLRRFLRSVHTRVPVGRGRLDEVAHVVHAKDVARALASGRKVDFEAMARSAAIVHDGADLLDVLDALRRAEIDMVFVVDEYGTFEGLLTSADLLAAIAGQIGAAITDEDADAVQRPDGSWLVDGGKPIDETADLLSTQLAERGADYHTLAGFVLEHLRRLPRPGDSLEFKGWCFEVVDMDGRRIDKVLIREAGTAAEPGPEDQGGPAGTDRGGNGNRQ